MDVILHIGAHRCATTTFQHYMRLNAEKLTEMGVGFWGPRRTRTGLFRGVSPIIGPASRRDLQSRAHGRVRLHLDRSQATGLRHLIVSDENMLGSMRDNMRTGQLYAGAGERVSRYFQVFGGQVSDIILNIRGLDAYWASALGYGLTRGHPVPDAPRLAQLAGGARSWRDVIGDVACASPGARLWVLPFETFAGRPETQLGAVTALNAPKAHARDWLNATPHLPELRALLDGDAKQTLPDGDGRWQPFDTAQQAALRERYADDLMWMTAGADGLAWLMDDPDKKRAGMNPTRPDMIRGRHDDDENGRMARAR